MRENRRMGSIVFSLVMRARFVFYSNVSQQQHNMRVMMMGTTMRLLMTLTTMMPLVTMMMIMKMMVMNDGVDGDTFSLNKTS